MMNDIGWAIRAQFYFSRVICDQNMFELPWMQSEFCEKAVISMINLQIHPAWCAMCVLLGEHFGDDDERKEMVFTSYYGAMMSFFLKIPLEGEVQFTQKAIDDFVGQYGLGKIYARDKELLADIPNEFREKIEFAREQGAYMSKVPKDDLGDLSKKVDTLGTHAGIFPMKWIHKASQDEVQEMRLKLDILGDPEVEGSS